MADSLQPEPTPNHYEYNEADGAFVALLTKHQPDLHAFINSLLPGDPEVEDVLQRSNMVLWKKHSQFEIGTNFIAWAFSIARWETRAWLTEKKRKDWLVFNDELTDQLAAQFQESFASANTLPGDEESNLLHALRLCLGKLKDNERFLIYNYYQNDKSLRECATVVNKKEGAVRVALFRIRSGLRKCIDANTARKGLAQ